MWIVRHLLPHTDYQLFLIQQTPAEIFNPLFTPSRTKPIVPVIPPPKTAIVHGKPETNWHDFLVSYIQRKGSIYAFHQKFSYGLRERVEAHFSRIIRCLGNSFKTIKLESQKAEAVIISNILNLWNSFGRPVSVKIG